MANSPGYSDRGIDPAEPVNCDPFEGIQKQVLSLVARKGGKVLFCDVEEWAASTQIGKYTLRTIIIDLIDEGRLCAPDGYISGEDGSEPPVPKCLEIPHAQNRDVCTMKRYLSEYWSVGELRLFEDMLRLGIKDVNDVLKEVAAQGYVVLTQQNVVNATEKLLQEAKAGRVADK